MKYLITALLMFTLYCNVGFTHGQLSDINLIDQKHIWKSINYVTLTHNHNNLVIDVKTKNPNKVYNRAFQQTQLNITGKPLLLDLSYSSNSSVGNATFYIEIGKASNSNIAVTSQVKNLGNTTTSVKNDVLWASKLVNTHGKMFGKEFNLPLGLENQPIVLKLYVITSEPGEHTLTVTKARIHTLI